MQIIFPKSTEKSALSPLSHGMFNEPAQRRVPMWAAQSKQMLDVESPWELLMNLLSFMCERHLFIKILCYFMLILKNKLKRKQIHPTMLRVDFNRHH